MSDTKQKLRKLIRLTIPTPALLAAERKVRKSGFFDATFYRGVNPQLHPVCKAHPIRHYLLYGEKMGFQPNPDFSPLAYLQHNADLQGAIRSPLMHYIQAGQFEQRIIKELPKALDTHAIPAPVLRASGRPDRPFAVVVHVYYIDLWPEIADTLRSLPFEFDLFVDVIHHGDPAEALVSQIRDDFPGAVAYLMPNQGRDIFPFVHLVNSGKLDGYRAICKIHTKKSPHRQDGDHWRQHLIGGLLGPDLGSELQHFLDDPKAAVWVADGQFYRGSEWWGSNHRHTRALLWRVELDMDEDDLSFPAGSMYWLKPPMLSMIRGMRLTQGDFDTEMGQVDGTVAHAFERVMGYLVKAAGRAVRQTSELAAAPAPVVGTAPRFVSAFYLPQFHPTPENDEWWGKGFTEWRNVVRATPQFPGHPQPALPSDLGFYDLRVTEVMGQQTALARAAGIDAFCVYHYAFDGGVRVLERPLDLLLQHAYVDFPFYLCWANESWRRNWDGLSGDVLMPQTYAAGFAEQIVATTLPYMRDPRYARPDGTRPRFVIYRPEDMPDPIASIAALRQAWRDAGIGEVELGAVRFHIEGENPVPEDAFDFWVEMPPHGLVTRTEYLFGGKKGNLMPFQPNPAFRGLIYDYQGVIQNSIARRPGRDLPANTIAGVMPSWDNTARRGVNAHIAWGGSPATFRKWLDGLAEHRISTAYRQELMINSWNEWAERAMIEPSEQYGTAWLRTLRDWKAALTQGKDN